MPGRDENENADTQDFLPQENTSGDVPTFCAIEEHAKTLEVSAPVFAAVRQYKGWAAGKKVEKSDFEKAVKDFLGAPTGGKK